jgi:hypothetical protein
VTLGQNDALKSEGLETVEKPVEVVEKPGTSAELLTKATEILEDTSRQFDESTKRSQGQVEAIGADPDTPQVDAQHAKVQVDILGIQGQQVVADTIKQVQETAPPIQTERPRFYTGDPKVGDAAVRLDQLRVQAEAKLALDLEIPDNIKPGTPEYLFYQLRNEKILTEKAGEAEPNPKLIAENKAKADSLVQQQNLLVRLMFAKTKPSPEMVSAYKKDLVTIIATRMNGGQEGSFRKTDPDGYAGRLEWLEKGLKNIDFQKVADSCRRQADLLRHEIATKGETEELVMLLQEEEEAAAENQRYADFEVAIGTGELSENTESSSASQVASEPEPAEENIEDDSEPEVVGTNTTPDLKVPVQAKTPKAGPENTAAEIREEVSPERRLFDIQGEVRYGNLRSERVVEITRDISLLLEGNNDINRLIGGASIALSLNKPPLARQFLNKAEANNHPAGKITLRASAEYSCIIAQMFAESGDVKSAQTSLEKAQSTYPELDDRNEDYAAAVKEISKQAA